MGIHSVITGTGSIIPARRVPNSYFPHNKEARFYGPDNKPLDISNEQVRKKFREITGIDERRYVTEGLVASDIAWVSAGMALDMAGVSEETIDTIIVAHNFGDISSPGEFPDMVPNFASRKKKEMGIIDPSIVAIDFVGSKLELLDEYVFASVAHPLVVGSAYAPINELDSVIAIHDSVSPSLAYRVKEKLGIQNQSTVTMDLVFGCPGWLQGVIHADNLIKSGLAKRVLVIGAETLSKVADAYDRDSMIYADGAGAVIMDEEESNKEIGVLSFSAKSYAELNDLLTVGPSYHPTQPGIWLKMQGRRVYEFAVGTVPLVAKEALDKAGLSLGDVGLVLLHQANAKMDYAILKRLCRLYGMKPNPDLMPMTIHLYGNPSVATIPTMLDKLVRGQLGKHSMARRDVILLASVGAGMNVNALVYRVP